ncbi:MAG: helix-turn-helix domain-containing protein [Candidatus Acidiferrales bacterium]
MNDPITDDVILTGEQAAKIANQRPATLVKWRQRGRGPVYLRLGGKVRYRRSDLMKWIEASRINPADKNPKRRRVAKRKP